MSCVYRVFPRKTNATPDDDNARIGNPGLFDTPDEVKISVAFTWDIPEAERLAKEWSILTSKIEIGGPALNSEAGEFTPGEYLRKGYTITSRGCNNKCWFCYVWKREKELKEMEIKDGWILQDNNILGCSEPHIKKVFDMLSRQPYPAEFTGGIEAKLLKPWHVDLFKSIKVKSVFCAYDTPDDLDPLIEAGKHFNEVGINIKKRNAYAYVLIGGHGDTIEKAEKRLNETINAGFIPFAMLYRDDKGKVKNEWIPFQREWANMTIIGSKLKGVA